MEARLNIDMGMLTDCLRNWHLWISIGMPVPDVYHLNNRYANRELTVVLICCLDMCGAEAHMSSSVTLTSTVKVNLRPVRRVGGGVR